MVTYRMWNFLQLKMNGKEECHSQNPRNNANIFEILTFSWMLNLFKTGRKRVLEESDLYTTLNDHASSSLSDELEKKWKLEVIIAQNENRKPSLSKTLIQMFGAKYMLYGFFHFIDTMVLKMCQPLLIGELLSYFNPEGSNKTDLRHAYICASGLVVSMLTSMVLYHYTQIEILHCGMKIRVACCSAMYRKVLRLSHTALVETTVGQVINLLSNDVNRFDIALHTLHFLWIGPLQTIVVTYLLWQEIGISSLFGIATLLFFIPLQGWFGKKISVLRSKTAYKTDERVRLMNEIILGIRVIKMYTWEKPFSNLIEFARRKEIQQIRKSSYFKAILLSFKVIQTRFQMFISLLTYILLGNYISIRKVFVIASCYNLLILTMTVFFCQGMEQIAELKVTIERIQTFFMYEEKENQSLKHIKSCEEKNFDFEKLIIFNKNDVNRNSDIKFENENLKKFSVLATNATAKWAKDLTVNALERINLLVRPNQLVAVIGPVGAGKTSLFQAILRELSLSEGNVSVNGIVSYASQEPWLFAGTVQQNIIFDSHMDKERYKEVVKVCALISDFKRFPYGDKTMIGERGSTLSGGQKARINLARAIYKQADIYLLDDPLSAVDTRVGTHLFEKCIRGYLKTKTCILITHQIQYLTNVDRIVLMKNAKIVAEGSYRELQDTGFDFTLMLRSPEEVSINPNIKSNIEKSKIYESHPKLFSKGSNESILSLIDERKPQKVAEHRSPVHNTKNVYTSYFRAAGNPCKVIFFFFIYVVTQGLITGGDYWISFWVNQESYVFRNKIEGLNATYLSENASDTIKMTNFNQWCIVIYAILTISMILAILIQSATFVSICMRASINLHNKMFSSIIRATLFYFNMNSSGGIFNRFSKDMGVIDEILPLILLDCFQIVLSLLGIVFLVGLVNIYLMIPSFIVGIIFYYLRVFYLTTSRSVKRLEGVRRSPIFSHLNESIQGLTTIRAHGAEKNLSNVFDEYQDLHSTTWYLCISSNQAFGFWSDIVCVLYINIVVFSFLIIGNNTYGGNVGLAITQIIRLTVMIQWGLRQSTILENQMTSVESVLEYINFPQEATLQSSPEKTPPKEWPHKGQIVFQNCYLRYSPDTTHVLKNVNIIIQPMEKVTLCATSLIINKWMVGIVGRTGAGKSSLIGALFRLAHNEGDIIVDDIKIHELGLHDLRSKFSIIPQEPILFSGTMRKNLDPFDEYPDHVLWSALDEVELKVKIESMPSGLNSKVSESGSNFSVGQKQLVCLARSIVRNNKILVLDEATANVDPQTDALIQNTIRNKFRSFTVLTIAHRLNTVMDSDKILVMDAGSAVEFDHPYTLLKNKSGFLYKMVEQTGQINADLLHCIAAESFNNMQMTINSRMKCFNENTN